MRVVTADDHGPPLRWLRRVLSEAGHEVVGEAWNGQQAVDFCAELKPDVAILDVAMQPMTGAQAARIILADKTARQVILVTSNTQAPMHRMVEAIGCKLVPKLDDERFILAAVAEVGDGKA